MNLKHILQAILDNYALLVNGDHGISHWARVLENGLKLVEETGADARVVSLFAVFHDSRRINDACDPGHGLRGADFAASLRGDLFELDDRAFRLLYRACEGHTDERTHPDVTIQTCWDADRLDLGRVGITPHPSYLSTDVAKRPAMIKWADRRATFRVVPDFVLNVWGIDVDADH